MTSKGVASGLNAVMSARRARLRTHCAKTAQRLLASSGEERKVQTTRTRKMVRTYVPSVGVTRFWHATRAQPSFRTPRGPKGPPWSGPADGKWNALVLAFVRRDVSGPVVDGRHGRECIQPGTRLVDVVVRPPAIAPSQLLDASAAAKRSGHVTVPLRGQSLGVDYGVRHVRIAMCGKGALLRTLAPASHHERRARP